MSPNSSATPTRPRRGFAAGYRKGKSSLPRRLLLHQRVLQLATLPPPLARLPPPPTPRPRHTPAPPHHHPRDRLTVLLFLAGKVELAAEVRFGLGSLSLPDQGRCQQEDPEEEHLAGWVDGALSRTHTPSTPSPCSSSSLLRRLVPFLLTAAAAAADPRKQRWRRESTAEPARAAAEKKTRVLATYSHPKIVSPTSRLSPPAPPGFPSLSRRNSEHNLDSNQLPKVATVLGKKGRAARREEGAGESLGRGRSKGGEKCYLVALKCGGLGHLSASESDGGRGGGGGGTTTTDSPWGRERKHLLGVFSPSTRQPNYQPSQPLSGVCLSYPLAGAPGFFPLLSFTCFCHPPYFAPDLGGGAVVGEIKQK